ncbi:MAG: carboxylating nicotinate-nucleotide diphosphorylase [Candidatus Cloacimonetes bacterium]|nr:carboxylating nicotinate-nucleotide diphosphorylase [Candidatus Cloacimonadota bacterium]
MKEELIRLAFEEDLQDVGDVTSQAIFGEEEATYKLFAKDDGILCGAELFKDVFLYLDNQIKFKFYFEDGNNIFTGDLIAEISGKVLSILQAERVALNFLSNLSAVATKTNKFVQVAAGKCKILDTRKTLPGYRKLQKYAVKCGGGTNHRLGLFDMVMIKDNHHDAAGGITKAVDMVRKQWSDRYKIEVETRNLAEVEEALACNVDVIMLDNMSNEQMRECVKVIAGKAQVEASGNMTLERIDAVADTGVDFISIGELTHTIKAFDFSLRKN